MRLYLHHRPVGTNFAGERLFSTAGFKGDGPELRATVAGCEPPLYCPPTPDAEMARLLGIRP